MKVEAAAAVVRVTTAVETLVAETTAAARTFQISTLETDVGTNTKMEILTTGTTGVGIEEVVGSRIESVTCLVTIVGKSRKGLREIAETTAGMMTDETMGVTVGGMIQTGGARRIGQYRYRGMKERNSNYLVLGTPGSTLASMKIYLLRQPVIKSRVTLHL